MLLKMSITNFGSQGFKLLLSNFSTNVSQKRGNIYVKSTNKNIFCSLLDVKDKKVKASCSLRVPKYENEFNERVSLFKRGILLGQLFGDKATALGYKKISVFLDSGVNKGRKGFIKGLGQKRLKICFIQLLKAYPHNGCRPSKMRRKKVRTKQKI